MSAVQFPSNVATRGGSIMTPEQDVIEGSLNLRQASLADAARYGGPIMREALDGISLFGDRRYVVVDTKVTFLMPGMVPAIPGWHTDGVPRRLNPGDDEAPMYSIGAAGRPHLGMQVNHADEGIVEPRYHLLVTGQHSRTEFVSEEVALSLPVDRECPDLYERMTRLVNERVRGGRIDTWHAPQCEWVFFDWWSIHRAVPANSTGWRYLIRVTESDDIAPRVGPSNFIRPQSQVYVQKEFGW